MYYKRINSGAVDAVSPRENWGSRRMGKEVVERGRKVEGPVKREREKKGRDSRSCIAKCIEAHPDESILARIDFVRAYLVDNGIQTRWAGTFYTCSRHVWEWDKKKKKKKPWPSAPYARTWWNVSPPWCNGNREIERRADPTLLTSDTGFDRSLCRVRLTQQAINNSSLFLQIRISLQPAFFDRITSIV